MRQHVEEGLNHNDAKLLALVVSSESFEDEFEGDVLQDSVQEVVLDYRSEKLGYLGQVLRRVAMEEPILVEETVKHAGVNLLLLDNLAFLEVLHGHYELFYSTIHFLVLS